MGRTTGILFVVPVRDPDVSSRFYCDAFGLEEVFRDEHIVFVGFPGTDSAVGLLRDPDNAGAGPRNIGFHMDHGTDRNEAIHAIERAGGRVVERGEHAPDVPFARVADPDGNIIEV